MKTAWTMALLLSLIGGCSSTTVRTSEGNYSGLSCAQLNELVAGSSSDISRTAVTRGQIEHTDIPRWLPGGQRVGTKLVDRQTVKLDTLQQQQAALLAARDRNCPGR